MTAHTIDILYSEDHDLLIDHIFEQIEHHLQTKHNLRSFLVVPEAMKVDMERHFITKTDVGAIMMTEVLSFRRLATRLFAESGTSTPVALSNAGKAILAQRILLDQAIPFRTFKRMAGQPRYAAELVHILGDFQRYNISSDELLQIDSTQRATLDKFHDFALLKNAMEEELEHRGLGDPDCMLTALASLLLSSPLPKRLSFLTKAHIWIAGFGTDRQFTSQEMDVLRGLASHVTGMTITVTADYPGGNRGALAFQHGRATIDSLSHAFPGIRTTRVMPQSIETIATYSPDINKKPTDNKKREVHLIEAINVHEEARYCAGKIRELLLTEEIRRRDIGIALCDNRLMPNVMETTFSEYDINAWIDTRKPLSQSSFARTFAALLSLCSYDFSLDQLMDYYRGGLSPLSDDIVDSFENTALALGWMSARDFRELDTYPDLRKDQLANRFQGSDDERSNVETALEDVFNLLTFTSTMRGIRNGHDKSELLLDFLFSGEPNTPADRVKQRCDTLLEHNRQDSATLLVSSWNATIDLLRESQELLGKTRISQDHYTQLLLAGLEGLVLPALPMGADHVRVGSLRAMATWPCRVLFVLGATATAFPPESPQQGYLRDEERALLSKETDKPFPNRQQDDPAAQAWLIHMLLSRPTRSLYVSVPTLNEDEQSYVFNDLKDKTPQDGSGSKDKLSTSNDRLNDSTQQGTDMSKNERNIIDHKPTNLRTIVEPGHVPDVRWNALKAAQRILRWHVEAPPMLRAAVDELEARQEKAQHNQHKENQSIKTDRPLPALAYETAEKTRLQSDLASRIIASRAGVSASLLQQYNSCPFRYFAEYIACASERIVAKDKLDAQGTMLHRLTELATRDLVDRLQHAETAETIGGVTALWRCDVDSADYMRQLYRVATDDRSLRWYAQPSSSGGIGERLRLYASKTLQAVASFGQERGFSPRFLEWFFPNDDSKPYRLCVRGVDFTLRGLIDRVEENLAGDVRIVDFKRTGRDFSWVGLYDGTDLQLPLYKLAFEAAFPEKRVEELYYCGFRGSDTRALDSYDGTRLGKNETMTLLERQKKHWKPDVADHVAQFAEKKAIETINCISSGTYPARPTIRGASDNPCRYCDWRAACGYDHRLSRNKSMPTGRDTAKEIRQEILGEIES